MSFNFHFISSEKKLVQKNFSVLFHEVKKSLLFVLSFESFPPEKKPSTVTSTSRAGGFEAFCGDLFEVGPSSRVLCLSSVQNLFMFTQISFEIFYRFRRFPSRESSFISCYTSSMLIKSSFFKLSNFFPLNFLSFHLSIVFCILSLSISFTLLINILLPRSYESHSLLFYSPLASR